LIDVRQQYGGLDIGRIAQQLGWHSADRSSSSLSALIDSTPSQRFCQNIAVIGSAGKTAGDADNRNTGGIIAAHHFLFVRARLV
jgi:hypothetical protein